MVVWTETDVSLVSRRQRRVCFVYIDDCAQLCYGPSLSFSQLSWLLRPFWEMFQSGVLFSDRQFFSIGGGAEWRVDFLCFGNILGSLNCDLNCGLILGRSLIVFYWNFLLFDAHGWHHFIYGMIAWVNLPLSDKYGWLDSVYGRMDLINGLVSLFDGLLLNMYECCNQIFSYVLLVFDQTLLSDLFWFSILTPFAKPAMSDILKMMANLHFTEKEIEEIDTLHFEDEHQEFPLEDTSTIGQNMFFFKFVTVNNAASVLARCPWSFNGDLLALKTFDKLLSPLEYDFNPLPIWIHIFNIPLGLMTAKVGEMLGNQFGTSLATDLRDGAGRMGEFMRIQAEIDCSKPLCRFVVVGKDRNGKPRIFPV
ncbi:hypothetical protein V6N12_048432 [Hibiscus sabdariffa]|uniref:DUF4283 domain-containing protein n=1 Tax=Hibiscus sabdariffa TaxID=183260 RepID=A0ABR2EHA3_9ROSI